MKTTNPIRLCIALATAALLGAATTSEAQFLSDTYTNTFDAGGNTTPFAGSGSVASWIYWYNTPGGNTPITNDVAMDANGNPNSGSLQVDSPFPAVNPGDNQNVFFGTFGNRFGYDFDTRADLTKYTTITFDIHFETNTPLSGAENFGTIGVGMISAGYGYQEFGRPTIPASASNTWVRLSVNIDQGASNLTNAPGIAFNYNAYSGYPLFPVRFWIDNLQVNRLQEVLPPPTLSSKIENAVSGLNLFSSSTSDNQYQRTSVKLLQDTGVGWLGQPDVTYSMTITNFPDPKVYTNYQAHIFVATPDGAPSIDYNSPNLVWLNVQGNADGGGTAYFRYKIFEPGANSNLFGAEYTSGPVGTPWAGQLTNLVASTPVGTWSMTFNQDTNVTLRGPGDVSVAFSMRPEVAAQFTEPLNVLFGAQPNQPSDALANFNRGKMVVLSGVTISNSTGTVIMDDNFLADTVLNEGIFQRSVNVPDTIQLFPFDPGAKLVRWTLPDTSFGLQATTNLVNPGSWSTLTGSEAVSPALTFILSGFKNGLVPSANLGPNQNFFRMFTRKFTKLQVLMPGEAADPGSATGKTGTPDPQAVGVPFNIIVNAVDANWFPAGYNSGHTVHITSTDGAATLPADVELIGGNATLSVTLNTAGSFTITASDVTDPTKTASTSPAVTVNP